MPTGGFQLGDGVRFGAYVSEVAIRVMAVSWQSNSIHSVFSVVFLDLPIRDCHSWYYRHLVACFFLWTSKNIAGQEIAHRAKTSNTVRSC